MTLNDYKEEIKQARLIVVNMQIFEAENELKRLKALKEEYIRLLGEVEE